MLCIGIAGEGNIGDAASVWGRYELGESRDDCDSCTNTGCGNIEPSTAAGNLRSISKNTSRTSSLKRVVCSTASFCLAWFRLGWYSFLTGRCSSSIILLRSTSSHTSVDSSWNWKSLSLPSCVIKSVPFQVLPRAAVKWVPPWARENSQIPGASCSYPSCFIFSPSILKVDAIYGSHQAL